MATTKRVAKEITSKEDISYLVNLTEDETLKLSFIMEMFGDFGGKRRFNPYDTVIIPPGSYQLPEGLNKNPINTTVGKWIFNKAFIEKDLNQLFRYTNADINDDEFSSMNQVLSYALLEDDISIDKLKRFIMKCQKFQPYVSILSPSYTLTVLNITKDINKKKNELIKKYEKELKAGDEKTADIIEKELLDYAKEILKDDPYMDLYNSGARGSFKNNFKNQFIMKGAMKDPDPNKGYNIATSSYMDGIKKEDYTILANSLAAGPYARAKKTEIGGYWEKLFISAFQHIILDKAGSDCGTKRTISINVDKKNINDLMYSYVVQGNKLVEITSKNRNNFINTTIKMRFSSMCEAENICNACSGNLYYRLGITNVGLTTAQIPSKLKNVSMKAFHDSSLVFTEMDVMKAFGF
jgi:hypothetical protein